MITAEQRKAEFMKDFDALLKKHKACFEVGDDGQSYGMHLPIAEISMLGVYDDSDLVEDYCSFELPKYVDHNKGN